LYISGVHASSAEMLEKWEAASLLWLHFARRCSQAPPCEIPEPQTTSERCLSAVQKAPKPWARKSLSKSPHFIFYLEVNVLAFAHPIFYTGWRKSRPQ